MIELDLQVLGFGLIAGLLVLATHIPLGVIVLGRGIIFIDIAVAQVAATGVVFGGYMWGSMTGWVVQISAISAALSCVAFLIWTDKRFPEAQEAIIGCVYVFAAAVQLMLLSVNPSGSEFLKQLLVGQILWVTPLQLLGIGLIYAIALTIWYFRDMQKELAVFYVVFAVVITLSVQVVGILLVFASLIVPALASRKAPPRWRHLIAFNIGAAGYVLGLLVSALFNTPTGAAIVCCLVPVAVLSSILVNARNNATPASADPADRPQEASTSGVNPPDTGSGDWLRIRNRLITLWPFKKTRLEPGRLVE
ncbi:MAG: metal ABC transporter permease [Rhodospirillales bacterium]|nr:metal ABC transporter permease [Rhodospirillales bacterium]